MSQLNALEELYWQGLGAALRALVGLAAVTSAACAVALTLTGAAVYPTTRPAISPVVPACKNCLQPRSKTPAALLPTT